MPLSLTSIVQRMIDKGRDLNSLAKGNGGLDWVTSQSLDENKSFTEETPEGKWFTLQGLTVKKIIPEALPISEAYILIYKRRD